MAHVWEEFFDIASADAQAMLEAALGIKRDSDALIQGVDRVGCDVKGEKKL